MNRNLSRKDVEVLAGKIKSMTTSQEAKELLDGEDNVLLAYIAKRIREDENFPKNISDGELKKMSMLDITTTEEARDLMGALKAEKEGSNTAVAKNLKRRVYSLQGSKGNESTATNQEGGNKKVSKKRSFAKGDQRSPNGIG